MWDFDFDDSIWGWDGSDGTGFDLGGGDTTMPVSYDNNWWGSDGGDGMTMPDTYSNNNWWGSDGGDGMTMPVGYDDSWWGSDGGDGTIVPQAPAPSGPGYYNEITGEFIPDPNGQLQGPLSNETSGTREMKDWKVDPATGRWYNGATGQEFKVSPWNPNAPGVSGRDILNRAGIPSTMLGNILGGAGKILGGMAGGGAPGGGGGGAPGGAGAGGRGAGGGDDRATPGGAVAPNYNFQQSQLQLLPIQTISSILGPRLRG